VNGWTASGKIGVLRVKAPSISGAVEKYFADAEARQLQKATLNKQTALGYVYQFDRATYRLRKPTTTLCQSGWNTSTT
jgi:hypothetical protein